jgi:DNA primase
MAVAFVDFADLKTRVKIEDVVSLLALQGTYKGEQWRGPCPTCQAGGERALAVNTGKQSYYCFAEKKGGDLIAFAAHIKQVSQRDAALWLDRDGRNSEPVNSHREQSTVPAQRPQPQGVQDKTLQPLQYLEPAHPKVAELGISKETASLFGAGYAPKGVLRGRFAVPVKSRDGKLLAYCGIAVEKEQSPRLLFHNFDPHSALFNSERVVTSGELWICRDPLQVLQAVENGIPPESVVSVLTDGITAIQFEQLSSLMDEKQIEHAQLF